MTTHAARELAETPQETYGQPLPGSYSSTAEECRALTEGVAILDRSDVGRLEVGGEDALDLLNRLTTNELMDLDVNSAVPTVLTSSKGRIMDLLLVLRLEDHLLVLTAPEARQKVVDWIDFYTFTENVSIRDVTAETTMLCVAGPGAASLLDTMSETDISPLERYGALGASVGGSETKAVRTDFLELPGYDLITGADDGERLWRHLLDGGRVAGIRPVGQEALTVVRVEQGVPAYGRELGEDYNPLEARLLDHVSFTKGCYVGQEVVTRLNTYKKVQKFLMGLRWRADDPPSAQARLLLEGKQVGVLTSAATSPVDAEGLGLGYVRKAHAQSGTILELELGAGTVPAEVVDLPGHRDMG